MTKLSDGDQALRARASKVIPGGMYGHENVARLPAGYPQYFARAEGCRLWDVDGREFIDYLCGYGPNLLGYRHPEVEQAARAQADLGDCMTGPAPCMVELGERLVDTIEHADWVLFCKNGTDATTICLTVARAHTGKRTILRARGTYHGAAPWCTPVREGVLQEDRAHIHSFDYNDVASLEAAVDKAGDDLAAVLLTPHRHEVFQDQALPDPVFVRRARELCDARGALLILDEVRTGLRIAPGGSWERFGVRPDLSAWGKTLGNGYPVSAVAGTEVLRDAAKRIYTTGSFWFAAVPMAAAIATLSVAKREHVSTHVEVIGQQLRDGLAEQALAHGFGLRQTGPVQMPLFLFDDDRELVRGNFFAAEAMRRGVLLHPWHNMFLSLAHTDADIRRTLQATDAAFTALRKANL